MAIDIVPSYLDPSSIDVAACAKCGKPFQVTKKRKRFCSLHCYRQSPLPILDRFWSYVAKTETCWLWTGAKRGKAGYGVFTPKTPRLVFAHRFSYELHFGSIPEGVFVCHTCDTRICVRPDHLFLGTHQDNMSDMVEKGRSAKGEKVVPHKLTSEQVQAIRLRHAAGEPIKALAVEYGVSNNSAWSIVTGRAWKHLPMRGDVATVVSGEEESA